MGKEKKTMEINNALIKHYLKKVMFINGSAYAGKSTMVKMKLLMEEPS